MRLSRAQPLRLCVIDLSVDIDRNAVIATRGLRGYQAVQHIVAHMLWIARARIAEPAAARQAELKRITRWYGLPAFRPDRAAGP